MIINLDELIELLKPVPNQQGVSPREALWVKIAPYPKGTRTKYEAPVRTVDYRAPDGNTLVNVDLDQQGAILGIEILS